MGDNIYIDRIINSDVENGEISGASICVIKDNKEIYKKNYGYANKEEQKPMLDNAIFRMFSMTKPITSVAMMILVERGIVDLNEPVSKYIRTFKNQKVQKNGKLVKPKREVLISDLMNMTSGMSYPDESTVSGSEVATLYRKLQSEQRKGKGKSTVEWCSELGKLPLEFEPGTNWRYGTSADVCGAIIEIASGMKLSEFLNKEIFEPLNMQDTSFFVPSEKWDRFTQVYEYTNNGLLPYRGFTLGITDYKQPPNFESAGAGLVSTIDDYKKFALMLLNKGEYEGIRILHRKSVEFITTPSVSDDILKTRDWEAQKGYSYGNLMRIMVEPNKGGTLGSVGEFGWDGWTGNYFLVDPKENLVVLYFIQRINSGKLETVNKLKNVIYSLLD